MAHILSLTGKRWLMPREGALSPDMPFVEALLLQRGMHDVVPSWSDPACYGEASVAADRIHRAVAAGEVVGLFGDYDCDGITGTAQMVRFFRRRNMQPVVRLPHRVEDGYGLKPQHVDELHSAGVTLIITIDTGVTAFDALEHAQKHNMDVIILDHHTAREKPNALAVVHPHFAVNADGTPAFDGDAPSAAGVVFSFLEALEGPEWHEREIDLVLATMGTVADLVALRGKNRALVQAGLAAAPHLPGGPLKDMLDHVSPGGRVKSGDIAYRIAPRINAAGRMHSPLIALEAILEGGAPLHELETLNATRQSETVRCINHAIERIKSQYPSGLPSYLVIADEEYPPGILGLIAGKLTEHFGRPSLAAHIQGDIATASLRSIPAYNVVESLSRVAPLLSTFGGHAQAAGCTFPATNLEELTEALIEDAAERLSAEDLIPSLSVDAVLDAGAIDRALCEKISLLEPFGQGNPEPLFLLQNVSIVNPRRVGTDGRHLQGMIGMTKLIAFGHGELMHHTQTPLDVLCRVGLEHWNGRVSPQVYVQDMRVAQDTTSSFQLSALDTSKKLSPRS